MQERARSAPARARTPPTGRSHGGIGMPRPWSNRRTQRDSHTQRSTNPEATTRDRIATKIWERPAVFIVGPNGPSLSGAPGARIMKESRLFSLLPDLRRRDNHSSPHCTADSWRWIVLAAVAGSLSIGVTILVLYATGPYQLVSIFSSASRSALRSGNLRAVPARRSGRRRRENRSTRH